MLHFSTYLRLLLIGLILAVPSGWVQAGTTGKIAGRVTDASGEPLPGVNVVIIGTTQGGTTDMDGYYAILQIKPGAYSVRASYIGYTPVTVEDVRVSVDKTTELDFRLQEETIQGEEVVVTAEKPLVQRDLTSTSASVSSEELQSLPVLNFSDVINLQAGVVDGHFRGGRVGEVAYLVDGVPINDVYDQTYAFQVENNAIQEVEIISGTFNAEYGQAQSGVVNIVTKDGGDRYEATLNSFLGDYLSTRTDQFTNIKSVSPSGFYEAQGTLGGPVPGLGKRLTFFASGRFVEDNGYLYGRRVVQPVSATDGQGQYVVIDGRQVFVPALGDSAYVSMNWNRQATGQIKLTARLFGANKLTVNFLGQKDSGQNYNHLFRYNPDGIPTNYGDSWSTTATYSQVFGSKTFLDVKGAYYVNGVDSYVYENPTDARYPDSDALRQLGGNFSFYRGGAFMDYFTRETTTAVLGLDLTSQVTRLHQFKAGVEWKNHNLKLDEFEVQNNSSTGFEPAVPPEGTPDHVRYEHKPVEAALYVQDKMEFECLIVNAGVRVDYFDAKGEVLEDFGRPQGSPRRASEAKWQVSPRIGLAYPLSETGVVHVAYGHFFQVPPFSYLYTNSDYIYDPEERYNRAFGYADLKPQQTVAYEVGLQQALTDQIGVNLTAYYKDIRNLLGTRLETIAAGLDEPFPLSRYGRFVNRDYGQVKGFIASFEKRMSGGVGLSLDYTFQIARGNASDPRSTLIDEQAGNEPEKQLVPLDWDRRHQLNASLMLGTPGNWMATLIGRLGSGLPYTPSVSDERIGLENSARRRGSVTFDLYASKNLSVSGVDFSVYTRVFNVFDTANETGIYSDTGRAFPNLTYYTGEPIGLNSKDEYLFRPDFYSAPRQVTVGVSLRI